jgi:hypothetical protein
MSTATLWLWVTNDGFDYRGEQFCVGESGGARSVIHPSITTAG